MGGKRYPITSLAGGVLAAVCFFLPWVGCRVGTQTGADFGGVLWLVFLAAVAIIGLFIHFSSKAKLPKAKAPIIVCAVVSIAIMLLKYIAFLSSEDSEFFKLKFGSIFTFLGFMVAIYGTSHFPKDE